MSLLTKTTKTSALLAGQIQNGGAHLAALSSIVNSMVGTLINLSDEDATAWLNAQIPADVEALFTAHAQVGLATNGLIAIFDQLMGASEIDYYAPLVDIRPVAEKLADQGRELLISEAGFSVITTPLPEPQPTPETPMEDPAPLVDPSSLAS